MFAIPVRSKKKKKIDVQGLIEEFVKLNGKVEVIEEKTNRRIDELIENTKKRLDEIQKLMEQRMTESDNFNMKFYEKLSKMAGIDKIGNETTLAAGVQNPESN
jgi:hypothetical protein